MHKILGAIRFALWVIHTAIVFLIVVILKLTGLLSYKRGLNVRRAWAWGYCRIYGMQIAWEGEWPEDETCLYVSNHRSSIDPFLIMSRIKLHPVARADLGNYPFMGWGARLTGIILVDRSSRESRKKAKTAIGDELKKGHSILIFPEGGTRTAQFTSTYQIGSFEQAASVGARVIPLVLDYEFKEDYWDHSQTAVTHMIDRFGKWRTRVKIRIGPPLESDNAWTLMRRARAWSDEQIPDLRQDWDN